jgi:uncharacterized RDD family membrane protein YckC
LSTPPVHIPPAPLKKRLAATTIDSIILGLSWFLLINLLHQTPATLRSAVFLAVTTFVYYFLLEGLFAFTIGKRFLKLRVVEMDGDPCTFGRSFKRNLFRFLDWMPFLYVLGGILMLSSRERQRLGDRVAGTTVTRTQEKDINPPPAPFLFH